jgi:hypothetical protein
MKIDMECLSKICQNFPLVNKTQTRHEENFTGNPKGASVYIFKLHDTSVMKVLSQRKM